MTRAAGTNGRRDALPAGPGESIITLRTTKRYTSILLPHTFPLYIHAYTNRFSTLALLPHISIHYLRCPHYRCHVPQVSDSSPSRFFLSPLKLLGLQASLPEWVPRYLPCRPEVARTQVYLPLGAAAAAVQNGAPPCLLTYTTCTCTVPLVYIALMYLLLPALVYMYLALQLLWRTILQFAGLRWSSTLPYQIAWAAPCLMLLDAVSQRLVPAMYLARTHRVSLAYCLPCLPLCPLRW